MVPSFAAELALALALAFPLPLGPRAPAAPAPAPAPPAPLPPPPAITAVRTPAPVLLDGKLDEAGWLAAPAAGAFTQYFPGEGAPPTERTEVRVLYDDKALYVGIDCEQRTAPVAARLTRRDRVGAADRVTVDISSRADRVSAFHFGVSAAGVLDDGIYFNDAEYSADWDENWEAATVVRLDGWSAELRIPFRILRFDAAPEQRWGIQVQRYIEARREWDLWSFRPRSSAAHVSTFGALEGLRGIRPARAVELRWVEVFQLRARDAEARGPLAPARDWDWALGADAKAHPTPGTTLDLTFNPDFGQVEADQVVLNLSNYEVIYPEKRPFFLEGADTFATPRALLYTRRIGARPPAPTLDVAAGEVLVDAVGPSRIWGATKLVGAVSGRTSVGALAALTGTNHAVIETGGAGARSRRLVDPLTLMSAFRVRHLFAGRGDLGFLATAVNRFAGDEAAGTLAAARTGDAYVAAVDGRWRSPSNDYVVGGQLLTSVVSGGPPRPQADGIPIEPGRPAFGATLTAAKQGGEHWLCSLSQNVSGRRLDYNDLGYLERKNDYFGYADLTYRTLAPRWRTLDTRTSLAASHRRTLDGIPLASNVRLTSSATFTGYAGASTSLYYWAPRFDDRETGDGTALERAGLLGWELWMGSDPRGRVTGAAWLQVQRLANGYQVQGNGSLMLRPLARLDLELLPSALYTEGEPRFAGTDPAAAGVYTFGRLRARTLGVTLRATVALRPTLTLQLYSQLFLAARHYESPSRYDGGGAFRGKVHLGDLQPLPSFPGGVTPDREEAVLNVNAVLRWEFRLGSVFYLVYTRAQSPLLPIGPGQTPGLDPGSLVGNRGATDVVLAKVSYWFG
jgi:hypothetical protein